MTEFDKLFLYLTIGLAIFLPIDIVKYLKRETIARELFNNNKKGPQKVVYLSTVAIIWSSQLLLFLSPIIIIGVPILLSYYSAINFWITFSCMVALIATSFVENRYSIWLRKFLDSQNKI